MIEYDVTISSKGQFVLPKEVREKFKLSTGSKIKIIVDGETIILKPRTIADELQDMILADIVKDGKAITEETVQEYKIKINKALDAMVAEAEQEYGKKEYVSLAELKRENEHVLQHAYNPINWYLGAKTPLPKRKRKISPYFFLVDTLLVIGAM